MFNKRRQKVANKLKRDKRSWLALVPGASFYYFTGVSLKQSERISVAFLSQEEELILILPEVEGDKANEVDADHIVTYKDKNGINSVLDNPILKDIVSDSLLVEEDKMRLVESNFLQKLGFRNLVPYSDTIQEFRVLKEANELENIQSAVHILESSLEALLEQIKVGMTEIEIASILEFEMKKRGSKGTPFETIVASGERSAKPHGRASEKKIRNGELVILDFGAYKNGYVGDMTRTIAVGDISKEQQEVYNTVKEAQSLALSSIRKGVTASSIDQVARNHIKKSGYGEYFTHRVGHGLGLDAHEQPYMMEGNELVLRPGMVFSLEPGIYLPGKFGVRIEDNVVVTEDSYHNFMNYEKELVTI